jgi:hypothetical protein
MKNNFEVTALFYATKTIVVESTGGESAAQQVYDDGIADAILCHHCANEVDLGECISVTVRDGETQVYTDDPTALNMQNAIKRAQNFEDQLHYLLEKVGVDSRGVYLSNANSKLDRDESLKYLVKLVQEQKGDAQT